MNEVWIAAQLVEAEVKLEQLKEASRQGDYAGMPGVAMQIAGYMEALVTAIEGIDAFPGQRALVEPPAPAAEPFPFKVGDWVRVTRGDSWKIGKLGQVTQVYRDTPQGGGPCCYVMGHHFRTTVPMSHLELAPEAKPRAELRKGK